MVASLMAPPFQIAESDSVLTQQLSAPRTAMDGAAYALDLWPGFSQEDNAL